MQTLWNDRLSAEGHVNVAISLCDLREGLPNMVKTVVISRECVRVWAQPLWVLSAQSKHWETDRPAGHGIYSNGFAAWWPEPTSISRPVLHDIR